MTFRNSETGFGAVTRGLHWITALGVIGMLPFGFYIARMEVNLSNYMLFTWHKSIGLTLLAIVIVRLLWHIVSRPPGPMGGVPAWQSVLAKVVHGALYLCLIAVPLSGWVASSATGIDVEVWGIALPHIAPASEVVERTGFAVHATLTKLLALLVVLHVAGALKRRDGTLRRMIRGEV